MSDAVEALEAGILDLPGVTKGTSRFGDNVAFYAGARELAHLHGREALDVRLGKEGVREHREELRAEPLYIPRKSPSPWAELRIAGTESVPVLLAWVRRALEG